ncbi:MULTISPECIES: acyl-CoA synthetase [unclassified Haloferax]|uniref:acyl-CoA synthetase n=1 Tax=unclassified Haloferax TaxID=2625095 RepID=UPI000E28471D|nr:MULTISPECIES: AMP-binding protein [unclassified Haloferax]RDZ37680.1 AMP-dependent synthetase [Haloferax sp. Atlit-24N]RLM38476.1 AMP-dependent synthetase [Haloferax sp. Atlit-109R]RLM46421.1 AMP-dependent synthetase [Haloferax sp. Atlit-105R]
MAVDYAAESESFEWDIPEHYNIPAVIESHADAFGDRVALRFRDADGGREERTYGDLRDDMNRFANALESMGVGKGGRLIHLLPRDPDVFAVQLGALKRGALLVPSSSMLKPKDIAFRANDCKATTAVVHESLVEMVDEVRDETPLSNFVVLGGDADGWTSFSDLVADASTEHDGPALRADDPMSINYTSGTTGQPKPVRHRHRWMRCFELVNAPYWWGVTADDDLSDELLWATTGTGWAKWFWSPVGVGLTTGATQFVYRGDFEPDAFLDIMEEEGVTRLCAVPTQYRMFAQRDLGSYDLRLKEALSAGEPLNREPIEAFREAFGVTPRDGYGQTETVALLTNYPGIDVKPGSMGKPTPGLGTTIIDENEEEVGVDEIGEIAVPVGCPGIFDGYYEKPNLDEKTFSGDYYRTGDLASRDEDGYFFFEGRADDIIISAGYRIGPFEVEDALVSHEAVAEAAAVASPHEERGSIVKAYVVLTDGYEGSDDLVDELQSFMKAQTAPYKYPREIEFVAELPKTSSGKIRRIELRSREQD